MEDRTKEPPIDGYGLFNARIKNARIRNNGRTVAPHLEDFQPVPPDQTERQHSVQTNHIAVLIPNLEAVSQSLPAFCKRHPVEEQPTESTKEQYVDICGEDAVMLLLVQPIGTSGPYSRALGKRGPGLHHIGCITQSIADELAISNKHQLLLHPTSLKTYPRGVIWLCRPGVPFLVELIQDSGPVTPISKCNLHLPSNIPIPDNVRSLSSNLKIHNADDELLHIEIGDRKITIDPDMS
ncbi:MAG: hypothetical protein HZA50_11205 [Planctomycetes bacterium]|nr:hypothetical protein [Planctomycetota bacterium]